MPKILAQILAVLSRLPAVLSSPFSLSRWRGRADTEQRVGGSGDRAGPAITGNETELATHIEYGFALTGRTAPDPGRWARLTIM